eukprot:1759867-Alexandrium_andersonii.AAC.1
MRAGRAGHRLRPAEGRRQALRKVVPRDLAWGDRQGRRAHDRRARRRGERPRAAAPAWPRP